MSCPTCSRLVLGAFLRDAGIALTRPSARVPGRNLRSAFRIRLFTESSSRPYRSSASRRNGLETTALSQSDDSYIPFETTMRGSPTTRTKSAKERGRVDGPLYNSESSTRDDSNVVHQKWIERAATSDFVPAVELEGEFKGVDVRSLPENKYLRTALHDDEIDQHPSPQETANHVSKQGSDEFSTKESTRQRNRTITPKSSASSQEGHRSNTAKATKSAPAEDKTVEKRKDRETWQTQKDALKTKFAEEGWKPRRKLSPDALEGIRALNAQYPDKFTSPVLAEQFEVSPEVIRRILKSKWKPNPEEEEDRRERWDRRGRQIWERNVALGIRPPKKWRMMGIGAGMPRPEHRRPRQMAQWRRKNLPKQQPVAQRQGKTQSGGSIAMRIM